jgi:PAS domain S-box-containing protein
VAIAPIDHGVAFHLHLLYTYVLMAALLWLLVRFYLRSRGTYRWQTMLLLVGGILPIATNVVWQVVQQQFPKNIDPTPLTFVIMGSLFTAGLHSFDLLELAPVGRHTIVEELHDAVLTVNSEERIVDSNPVARRLLAESGESLIGERATDVVPEYEALLQHGGEADDVAITVDGEPRYFDIRQTRLTDATEEVVGRVVLLRDVTERRRVEKRYQLLIENSTDLIAVLDGDATVRYVSPSVTKLLGYDPTNVEGTSAFGYVHPDDKETIVERFTELVENPDEELKAEYRMRTNSGDFRVFESRGRNLLDDPVIEGIVVNSRDVTGRREHEERLQQRNEQLEEFASVISHDLRNPLSVAHGYARLVADDYDDDRLEKIANAHDRMEELLEDLLTLAREGRAVSEPEPVSLKEAAHQAWAIVDTSGCTLTVEGSRDLLADDTRLRQLLENLYSNAAEHGAPDVAAPSPSADGGEADAGTVTIRVGTTDEGFFVADDGPGIPEADRERVFEAGESGADTGIGLGLTIVRRIADAHGWDVGVAEDADGARFEFTGVEWADVR